MLNQSWINQLNTEGYTIIKPDGFSRVMGRVTAEIKQKCGLTNDNLLADLHLSLEHKNINDLRLSIINDLNNHSELLDKILDSLQIYLETLLGPDIQRQKKLNLVIHMPNDPDSIIPIHSDVRTGNSSFEIGCWIPVTKCIYGNTMLILNYKKWNKERDWSEWKVTDFDQLECEPGEIVLFRHFLPHGNQLNVTDKTRVSLNIRFKNMFAPENIKTSLDYYVNWKVSEFTKISIREVLK